MVEYSLSDFIKHVTLGIPSGTFSSLVKWCDGIVFAHASLPSTPDVVKDQMSGIIHWAWFSFAEMYPFTDKIEAEHNVTIPIINVSNNDLNKELVQWLKHKRIGV